MIKLFTFASRKLLSIFLLVSVTSVSFASVKSARPCIEHFPPSHSKYQAPYKPVIWLPKTKRPYDPRYEFRLLTFDPKTGVRREIIQVQATTDIIREDRAFSYKQKLQKSYDMYTVEDRKNGIRFQRMQEFWGTSDDLGLPFHIQKFHPFYEPASVGKKMKPGFQKEFPAQVVVAPSSKEMSKDAFHVPKYGLGKPSQLDYVNYPEVTVHGVVSETHYHANLQKIELHGLLNSFELRYPSYRAMRIQTYKSGELTNEIYDVVPAEGYYAPGFTREILKRLPADLHQEFITLMHKNQESLVHNVDKAIEWLLGYFNITPEKIRSLSEELFLEGVKKQKAFVKEIMDFIIPLYRERRGWDEQKLIDFEQNGYKTMDNTRYIKIKGSDGRIAAVLGLTMVNYGKVKFFCKKRGAWVELMGPYGTSLNLQNGNSVSADKMPFPHYWNYDVDILPIETEGFELPRPSVPDNSVGLSKIELYHRLKMDKALQAKGYDIDLQKPIFFSVGRMIEPVKFGVAKDLKDLGLSNVEVLTQMLLSVFPAEFSKKFNSEGQLLVTYNTPEGARMYKRLGFDPIPSVPSKFINGEEWIALSATPASVVKAISRIRYMKTEEAQEILDTLSKL